MSEKVWGGLFIIIAIILGFFWILGFIALLVAKDLNALFFNGTNLWGIPVPPLIWLCFFPVLIAVLLVAVILGWVGTSLLRTPSLEEIDVEELEKEIEKEVEKIKKEEEEKEEKSGE